MACNDRTDSYRQVNLGGLTQHCQTPRRQVLSMQSHYLPKQEIHLRSSKRQVQAENDELKQGKQNFPKAWPDKNHKECWYTWTARAPKIKDQISNVSWQFIHRCSSGSTAGRIGCGTNDASAKESSSSQKNRSNHHQHMSQLLSRLLICVWSSEPLVKLTKLSAKNWVPR